MNGRRAVVRAGIALAAILLIAGSSMFVSAQGRWPEKVVCVDESVVYVFSWIDGTVDFYWEDEGWMSLEVCFPFSSASGFFADAEGGGYVITAAHAIEHDELEVWATAVAASALSLWWDLGEEFDMDLYLDIVLEKDEQGEVLVDVDTVDYIYHPALGEPCLVTQVPFRGDPEVGPDIAVLKVDISNGTPVTFAKSAEPEEGLPVYVVGYSGVDMDMEFYNAVDRVQANPLVRPRDLQDFLRMAQNEMLEAIRDQGPGIETGHVGRPTRFGGSEVYRFHGDVGQGLSGGPVVYESGCCAGMMVAQSDGERGYFIPRSGLDEVIRQVGFDIVVHKTLWDRVSEHKWHIVYALLAALLVAGVLYGIERLIRRRRARQEPQNGE